MGRTIALQEDCDGAAMRRPAKGSKDAGQSQRLLALAEIYDGGRRTDAARHGDVGLGLYLSDQHVATRAKLARPFGPTLFGGLRRAGGRIPALDPDRCRGSTSN